MYAKTGGTNSKNEWVSSTSNICAVSKVSVQVFECVHGRHFTAKPTKTATLNTHQFAHLPSSNILTLLFSKPQNIEKSGFDLSEADFQLFRQLDSKEGRKAIKAAMKTFRKRNIT
jgi:hypothetical protein